ncbi:MAG TPA: polymer-forming cytoskeletal protein [Terriglobales bacterium]|jgi:hypothetical protein|nr:polymer-forming cytoskeletal protein [Terriglobales bacterium]
MPRFSALLIAGTLTAILIPFAMAEAADRDRFQINHDIRISPDDNVADVTCINCSVHVRGHVSGDVVAIHGSVMVEQGASIAGDLTAIGGNARLESGSQVAGDLVAVGGNVRRDPQATVGGDVTSLAGGGWVFLVFLVPVVFLGGIIALIVWLVQRNRRPVPVPAYTMRRG